MHTLFPSLLQGTSKVAAALVCSVVLLLIPGFIHAATITPSVIDLEGARGEVVSETITIINTKTTDQTYYLGTLKFQASEDGGSPEFIPESEDHEGLPEWINFSSSSVTVPALSTGDVPFEIRIPSGSESGGHYAAITVSSAPEDIIATNGAIIDAKTAVLILLSIEGETNRAAALLDFTDANESSLRSVLEGEFSFRVQNQGNVHVAPEGEIRFQDLFGRTLLSVDANELESRILPGSTRTFEVSVGEEKGWFGSAADQMKWFAAGPVSIVLDLQYEEGGEILLERLEIFLFPWQLLLTVLGLGFVLWFVYRLGRKRR